MLWEDREWTEGKAVPESDLQAGTGLISHVALQASSALLTPHPAHRGPPEASSPLAI